MVSNGWPFSTRAPVKSAWTCSIQPSTFEWIRTTRVVLGDLAHRLKARRRRSQLDGSVFDADQLLFLCAHLEQAGLGWIGCRIAFVHRGSNFIPQSGATPGRSDL